MMEIARALIRVEIFFQGLLWTPKFVTQEILISTSAVTLESRERADQHTTVLYDKDKFSADELQMLTNSLCYTHARCTSSVSIVPLVHYAPMAASRARCYIEPSVLGIPLVRDNVKKVMYYC